MKRHALIGWCAAAFLAVAGCDPQAPADGADDTMSAPEDGENDSFLDGKADTFGIAEGSPEAVCVLRLANTLSYDELRTRAMMATLGARNIVAYRVGPDGTAGTADDRRILTLAELDRVPYVGRVAFERLVAYARATGCPAPDPSCTTDAQCGAGSFCILSRCATVADEQVATAVMPTPDSFLAGDVDGDSTLRLFSQTNDLIYQAVRGATWTGGNIGSGARGSYAASLRPLRSASGRNLAAYLRNDGTVIAGTEAVALGSRAHAFDAAYSPTGELMVVGMTEEPVGTQINHPVRLWRKRNGSTTWTSELVISSVFSDTVVRLRFRADGTPEVLTHSAGSLYVARRGLDTWAQTLVFRGAGTHAGGLQVLNTHDGSSHVFFATRTFMMNPSVGELIVDYLHIDGSGVVSRQRRVPVGGYGFTLVDASLDAQGNAYALVNGLANAGRVPTHLVKVAPSAISASVVANLETTSSVRVLGAAPSGTVFHVGSMRAGYPVQLRTITLR